MFNPNEDISGTATATSHPSVPLSTRSRAFRFGWLAPILVALIAYGVAFNNYFVYDDFIWLNRSRTFTDHWLGIFRPDVVYFDPLVHLLFRVNYLISGFDPHWYHAVDLAIHAANAVLVYRLVRLLNADEKSALCGSVLFASSFAIVDAVVWPSSRVDLLSTFFSLGALIQFLRYLRLGSNANLCYSTILFILALGAKGTPLVLPVVLCWLIIQEKKPFRKLISLVPFLALSIMYLLLLKLSMHRADLPIDRLHFDLHNVALAFCSLFIPEQVLIHLNLAVTFCILFPIVGYLAIHSYKRSDETATVRKTGYCILLAAILPVLILTELKLTNKSSAWYHVLLSPGHRIYLASVGAAILSGGIFTSMIDALQTSSPRSKMTIMIPILTTIVGCNVYFVRERDDLWQFMGSRYKDAFTGLLGYRGTVAEGAQIGLVNFPGSHGFLTPLASTALNLTNVNIIDVTIGRIADPDVLEKAEKTHLYVLAPDGHAIDKTEPYRQQLLFNRLDMLYGGHGEFGYKCERIAEKLGQEIEQITKNRGN